MASAEPSPRFGTALLGQPAHPPGTLHFFFTFAANRGMVRVLFVLDALSRCVKGD